MVLNSRAVSESATRRHPVSRFSHSRSSGRCRRTRTSVSPSASGDQQWPGEQGAERGPALRLFLGRDHAAALMMAPASRDLDDVLRAGEQRRRRCGSSPSRRPGPARDAPPACRRSSRSSPRVSPGLRAASASPSSARNSRNARGSSTSEVGQQRRPGRAETPPGRGGLGRLALGLPAQELPLRRPVPHLVGLAAPLVGPGLPELRGDTEGRRVPPRRSGRKLPARRRRSRRLPTGAGPGSGRTPPATGGGRPRRPAPRRTSGRAPGSPPSGPTAPSAAR